jgi:hypothetical protein
LLLNNSEILEGTNDVIIPYLLRNWSGFGDERPNVCALGCLTTHISSSATDTSIKYWVFHTGFALGDPLFTFPK